MYLLLLYITVGMYISPVDCLDCYSCANVNSTRYCQNMITCQSNENCFTETKGSGNHQTFQLGCKPHDQCLLISTQSPAIVGRSVTSQSSCSHCCALDGCNRALCAFENQLINEKGPCEDDPNFDCIHIGSALNVCGDVQHAKLICRKYCDLCDIVDGAWTEWSSWSHCDVSCDVGHMTKTRKCTKPAPEHGGLDCVGPSTDMTNCNLQTCPINGQWSLWTPWESCSVTCGTGLQRRYRNCTNPSPSSDGHYCVGNNMDARICSEKPCAGQDCLDVLNQRNSINGVYNIQSPYTRHVISVYCDMTTDGGGWTVFQKRFDGRLDFFRTFNEYEDGFGDVNAEFWMGLKDIHDMTSQHTTELRIDLTAADGTTAYETFQNFSVSPGPDYRLHIGQAAGTAGDTYGLTENNGFKLSTKDKDVDGWSSGDCAEERHGGWWYGGCASVNLNGDYATPGTQSSYHGGWGGVVYYDFKQWQSLKTTSMMFRRK